MRATIFIFAGLLINVSGLALGSVDTIGPNGINSSATGLSGRGVNVGQVEVGRPGRFGAIPGFDDEAHSDPTVVPTGVALLDDFTPPPNMNITEHAENVASVMISSSTTIPGVAPEALLYASAFAEPIDPAQPDAAFAAQHVALQSADDVRAINMSFGELLIGGNTLDGNSLLTKFMDWSARRNDVLYVKAGNEDDGGIPVGSDNYNGITVAMSRKNIIDGVYSEVSPTISQRMRSARVLQQIWSHPARAFKYSD